MDLPFREPFAPDSIELAFEAEAGSGGEEGISASKSSSTLSLWSAVCVLLASSELFDKIRVNIFQLLKNLDLTRFSHIRKRTCLG